MTGRVFEHEERYRELLKRQGELVDLLDIAKNQAAAQQATESTGDVESVAPVVAAASRPDEDESPGETPAPVVAMQPVMVSGAKSRRARTRRSERSESAMPVAPTVRLAPANTGRMRIAI